MTSRTWFRRVTRTRTHTLVVYIRNTLSLRVLALSTIHGGGSRKPRRELELEHVSLAASFGVVP